MKKNNLVLGAALVGLVAAGSMITVKSATADHHEGDAAKGEKNSCKGKDGCKGEKHSCKGHDSCTGKKKAKKAKKAAAAPAEAAPAAEEAPKAE
jgi:hypothetical protein